MIISEDLLVIKDSCVNLIQKVKKNNVYQDFYQAKEKLAADQAAQQLIKSFEIARTDYQQIAQYGKHGPDFLAKQKIALKAKRKMDLYQTVAEYKIAEMNLATLIDAITLKVTNTVSPDIMVETGNPFFTNSKKHHHGGK